MALASVVILDEQKSKISIIVAACLDCGAGNDPGEGGREGGGQGDGKGAMGRGSGMGRREKLRWGDGGGAMGRRRRRVRWRRAGKRQEWEGKGDPGGWTTRTSGVGRGR